MKNGFSGANSPRGLGLAFPCNCRAMRSCQIASFSVVGLLVLAFMRSWDAMVGSGISFIT